MLFVADDDSTLSMVTMLSGTSLGVGGDIPRIVRLVRSGQPAQSYGSSYMAINISACVLWFLI